MRKVVVSTLVLTDLNYILTNSEISLHQFDQYEGGDSFKSFLSS